MHPASKMFEKTVQVNFHGKIRDFTRNNVFFVKLKKKF